ncbi:MAG: UDP-N-acetylmuramoyl-tripeptide--D-alanyl-D-alanine ligase [Bacteroidales bacterium]|nr:UDP-N-acetylmuramoyl-tripeptide--D-alanyl-D-alanine ligase [Bacteroidales bacterium]
MTELYSLYLKCGGRVSTDSRAISGGELFFALKGENFDGNAYALKALEAGAAAAVVDKAAALPDDPRLVKVDNSFTALQQLAIEHRNTVCGGALPVIGLTGTNGKTTTKELISAVLATKYRVTATKGNLNNDIGVPLSLLSITPDTQIAVIEMGASHPDDIAKLVKVSQPDYGLITNVGKAHLLGFGSFEGVKAAKGELYRFLGSRQGSLIFINADDADLRSMAAGLPCHFWEYGFSAQKASILPSDAAHPFLSLKVGENVVHTHLMGSYNAPNVLAALAVGERFGVSFADAAAAIEAYTPVNNRSQLLQTASNTVIVDAYNANPSSMTAALDNFSYVQADRKVALLGDMRELGADSLTEHEKILRKAAGMGIDLYVVGEEFARALGTTGLEVCGSFPDSQSLASFLKEHPINNAVVLLKGSRGIMMEKVLESL